MSVKTAGVGHFLTPTAPAAGTAVAQSASANTYGTKTNIGGTALGALYITGVYIEVIAGTNLPTYVGVQLYVTASTVIDTMNVPLGPTSGVASTQWAVYKPIFPPVPVAASTQILAATASSVASAISYLVTLECLLATNYVDDGVAVGTVTTVTNQLTAAAVATGVWQDTTAGDFTTALSVGKSVMNGVALGTGLTINAYTGNTVQTGDSFAVVKSGGTGDNAAIKAKTDNLPAAPASTTNITAGTITTATNLTNAPTAGDFTAAMKTSLNAATPASVTGAVGSVTGLTASDIGAIKAKTDNLPTAPADETLVIAATNAIMARVGAPVGASISADVAGVPAAVLSAATASPIASEIKKVNGVTVGGTGAGATTWGPV